ncbi:uncharacterized protein LOC123319319 [Coccinella septempunctata]|uniref:uncharacterized protein LOC123319319 n=1 Tax=Coccinella septempunctata TaxID=41139 RepID=UPI001D084BD3|nr:uncharacterized protein LOC123319319 [Coccinella septempunctata]
MELYENNRRGAVPKKRDAVTERQITTTPYVEVSPAEDSLQYAKNAEHSSRRSLHDEVLRSALSIKQSLTVPVAPGMRRHSCNDTDAILDRGPFPPSPSRRNSQVKRTPSVVSTRSRRGSKYYCGVERRGSHLSGIKKADYALVVKEGYSATEDYRKEMRRRRIVWLVIGMFFFILAVSVLIVVITLTHRMDEGRRFARYNCTC